MRKESLEKLTLTGYIESKVGRRETLINLHNKLVQMDDRAGSKRDNTKTNITKKTNVR